MDNFCLKFILAKLTYLTLDFGAKCENPLFWGDHCFVVKKKKLFIALSHVIFIILHYFIDVFKTWIEKKNY